MRPVHDDRQALRSNFDVKALHAPGEARGQARVAVEKRRADRLAGTPAHPLAAKLAENSGCECEVDLFDRRRDVDARAFHPRSKLVGSRLHNAPRFVGGVERGDEHGAGFEDSDLLARDRRTCMAKNFRVLERDVGDDGDFSVDDIGRIEPSAQAHFDHRPLALRLSENDKGRGSEEVEPGCIDRGRTGRAAGLIGVERPIQGACERRLVDIVSLNAHPLGDTLNMGRCVAPDAKAGVRQRRFDQGRD